MQLLLVSLLSGTLAVGALPTAPVQVLSDTTLKNLSWSLIPIIFTSPDTDWAFGVLPQLVFRLPRTQRQSRVAIDAYYTLNKQYAVSTRGSFWFNGNRDHVNVDAAIKYWPTNFYGLSARNMDIEGTKYVESVSSLSVSGSRQFGPRFRLGLNGGIRKVDLRSEDSSDPPNLGSVQGHDGGWIVSMGPSIGLDSRNHVFYPTMGWFANVSLTLNGYALGGDYDFLAMRTDVRAYKGLSKNHVLAGQVILDFKSANVPFWGMKGIGSVLRGYSSSRFLDQHLAAFQLEYRFIPIFWRVGLTAFAGVGTVADRINELPDGHFRWAAGIGFRFMFLRNALINIRWDFGFGQDSSGDYLDMSEAF